MALPLQIDPLSSASISEQVVFQVKAAVARGELREGDQLPSVRELARELSINPNTVARCYQLLEARRGPAGQHQSGRDGAAFVCMALHRRFSRASSGLWPAQARLGRCALGAHPG
jgi:DNA-binding transcriptional MocR family regulator